MPDIKVATQDDKLVVTAPYEPDFPPAARNIGGSWSATDRTWRFDARDEQRVRELLVRFYGTDGTPTETVTVRIALDSFVASSHLYLFGRLIAERRQRDYSVRLGDGVILVDGRFPASGGTRANPRLEPYAGTVLEVRDVPNGHRELEYDGVTVVDHAVDLDALKEERERLVARLAEIDEQLLAAGVAVTR